MSQDVPSPVQGRFRALAYPLKLITLSATMALAIPVGWQGVLGLVLAEIFKLYVFFLYICFQLLYI